MRFRFITHTNKASCRPDECLFHVDDHILAALPETNLDHKVFELFIRHEYVTTGIGISKSYTEQFVELVGQDSFGYAGLYELLSGGDMLTRLSVVNDIWSLVIDHNSIYDLLAGSDPVLTVAKQGSVRDGYAVCDDRETCLGFVVIARYRSVTYLSSVYAFSKAIDDVLGADRVDKLDMLLGKVEHHKVSI
jgi:hypothetical protein